jgi:hypothetical protein
LAAGAVLAPRVQVSGDAKDTEDRATSIANLRLFREVSTDLTRFLLNNGLRILPFSRPESLIVNLRVFMRR